MFDFVALLTLRKTRAAHHVRRGHQCIGRRDFKAAADYYTRAIALQPDLAIAYMKRGLAWYNLGQHDRAADDCTRVLTLTPNDAVALNNQAMAYWQLKRTDEAMADLDRAQHWLREAEQLESPAPITAPPYSKPVPSPPKHFQFSLREVMLVLTALAVALALARLIEDAVAMFDADFPDRPEPDFNPCLGIFSIPILFFVGRACWRTIRGRRSGSRAFVLGAAAAGAVGIAHGLIWVLQSLGGPVWAQLPVFVLVLFLLWEVVIGGGSKTLFLAGFYSIAGGFAAHVLDSLLTWFTRRRAPKP